VGKEDKMLSTKLQSEMVKANYKEPFKMHLQLFGANSGNGEGTGEGEGTGGDSTTGTGEGEGKGEGDNKSFDDLLKDKNYQSEFDKKIAKALETAKGKWEADYKTKIEEAKTEAQKLAKMNADEKAKYEQEKRVAELEKREKDITTRELQATAKTTLVDKGLPIELYEILNYSDAESCNKSIEAVEKAFQTSVEKSVNEKLRGNGDPKKGQGGNNALQEQIAKAMRGQI